MNVRNTAGMTPLAYAASRGQDQLVSTLISMGCPVDTRNRDGTTPLHQAATAGNQVQLQMPNVAFPVPSSHRLLNIAFSVHSSTCPLHSAFQSLFALLNLKTYIDKKHLSYTGILNRETSGDSKNAFLHCGDVLALFCICYALIKHVSSAGSGAYSPEHLHV